MKLYLLDSCAVITASDFEEGYQVVQKIFDDKNSKILMHKYNLLEAYYITLKRQGKKIADEIVSLLKLSDVKIIVEFDDNIFYEAARFKATYKVSLADAIALATAVKLDASLVTSDHHEFDIIEKTENIKFIWTR